MIPHSLAAWFLAVTVLAALPEHKENEALEGDSARLQGKWHAMVGENRDLPVLLEIQGHKAAATFTTAEGEKKTIRGEFRLDGNAKPKTLDWVRFKAPDGADLPDNLAVYELEGDTFRVRNGGPNNPRPTKLDAGDGGAPGLLLFKREKDETRTGERE